MHFILEYFEQVGESKVKNNGFGRVMDISTSSQNHKNEDFSDFSKVEVQKYECPMNLNILTELFAKKAL